VSDPVARGARLPDRAVWVDGALVRGREASLSVFDRGARDGEGLFETVRVEGGVPMHWERHLERLVVSAALLGFPVPPSPRRLRAALVDVLGANGLRDAVARVTVTRGVPHGRPTRAIGWIDVEPLAGRLWKGTRSGAATLVWSRVPFEPGPLGRHKTTSRLAYQLAREEARAARADETLLVSGDGEVLEGAVSNLFVVAGAEVRTPPLARGILPGITRAIVLERCAALAIPAREARLAREDVAGADEIFVTNAVQGVVPVERLEDVRPPSLAVGRRLAEDFRRLADGAPAPR
jgi:branched-subunit amino acid aminotransferase/4-amino-4-deoxychorismate lyase